MSIKSRIYETQPLKLKIVGDDDGWYYPVRIKKTKWRSHDLGGDKLGRYFGPLKPTIFANGLYIVFVWGPAAQHPRWYGKMIGSKYFVLRGMPKKASN